MSIEMGLLVYFLTMLGVIGVVWIVGWAFTSFMEMRHGASRAVTLANECRNNSFALAQCREDLEKANSDRDTYRASYDLLVVRLQNALKESEDKEKEIEGQRRRFVDMETNLRGLLRTAETEASELRESNISVFRKMTAALDTEKNLRAELDVANGLVTTLKRERSDVDKRMSVLQDMYASLDEEAGHLRSNNVRMEEINAHLSEVITKCQDEVVQLKMLKDELESKNAAMADQLGNDASSYLDRLAVLEASEADLMQQVDEAAHQVTQAKVEAGEELAIMQANLVASNRNREALFTELTYKQTQLADAIKENAELNGRLKNAKYSTDNVDSLINVTEEAITSLMTAFKEAVDSFDKKTDLMNTNTTKG